MEKSGMSYISPLYKKEDYLNLQLQINSDLNAWDLAINIFKDRIQSRYFDAISELLRDSNKNGFVIMAINCLLVETLYQFKEGYSSSPHNGNKAAYINFLITDFPLVFDEEKAAIFYKSIRCGILHSAQTKDGSQLTSGKDYSVELFAPGKIRVDVANFTNDLIEYYHGYVRRLWQVQEVTIRSNFIKKMNAICQNNV